MSAVLPVRSVPSETAHRLLSSVVVSLSRNLSDLGPKELELVGDLAALEAF